jgi:diguanylate cyclase (GGDEF)-like protein
MFLDLDGFKGINDRLGHEAGDTVLRLVAERVRSTTRDSDSVARLGGDEFLVVAPHEPDAPPHEGMKVAERILAAVGKPVSLPDGGSSTTSLRTFPSIGIAQFPVDGDDVEELVRRADTAMYAAKQRATRSGSTASACRTASASAAPRAPSSRRPSRAGSSSPGTSRSSTPARASRWGSRCWPAGSTRTAACSSRSTSSSAPRSSTSSTR